MLLELADGALAVEQIADEEKGERAEAEEGDAKSPLVRGVGMDEDHRVHEDGEAAGQHEDEDGRDDGELEFAALELIEFLPVDGRHDGFTCPLEKRAAHERSIGCVWAMVARMRGWRNRSRVLAWRKGYWSVVRGS